MLACAKAAMEAAMDAQNAAIHLQQKWQRTKHGTGCGAARKPSATQQAEGAASSLQQLPALTWCSPPACAARRTPRSTSCLQQQSGRMCDTCRAAAAGRRRWQGRESAAAGRDLASCQPAHRPLPWLPAISGSRIDTAAQQLQTKQAYPGTGAGQTGPGAGPARCCSCRCARPATARWTAGS